MKHLIKCIFLVGLCFGNSLSVFGQKRIIDREACENWEILQPMDADLGIISDNGRYIAYQYGIRGKNNFVVLTNATRTYKIEFKQTGSFYKNPCFTSDNQYFILSLPNDSLVIQTLGTKQQQFISKVETFLMPKNGIGEYLVYKTKGRENNLIIRNISSGQEHLYSGILSAVLDNQGKVLLIRKEDRLATINLSSGKEIAIPQSENVLVSALDNSGTKVAFITKESKEIQLKYFRLGTQAPVILIDGESKGLEDGYQINASQVNFNEDDESVFFDVAKTNQSTVETFLTPVITKDVNVWSYKDQELQESQKTNLEEEKHRNYKAVILIKDRKVVQIENEKFLMCAFNAPAREFALLTTRISDNVKGELYWNQIKSSLVLLSLKDGKKKTLMVSAYPGFSRQFLSPDENFAIWFDQDKKHFYSYNISSSTLTNISEGIEEPLSMNHQKGRSPKGINTFLPFKEPRWVKENQSILVHTANDIWQLDPFGIKSPINLTHHFGKDHDITFNLFPGELIPMGHNQILTWAFDYASKQNGFYKISLDKETDPEKLVMDDRVFYIDAISQANLSPFPRTFKPIKAKNAEAYLYTRMSSTESLNLFHTKDFKTNKAISDILPEKKYQWIKAQLVSWKLPDGTTCDGVLNVPENLDRNRKYPVIFTYYERHSEWLNAFKPPGMSIGPINIPWFVSRGYLVFEIDFYYKRGKTSQSVIDAVETATKKLATIPYVDTSRMGAQGHSHGGYETNIIATGTHLFKAVCEMAGYTNTISEYGSIRPDGFNNQIAEDILQRNLGVFPWERPEVFIENSPVFQIGQMTTPLLMVHNKKDGAVLFSQAVELYLGMRRMKKKVWLLEYDNEGHGFGNPNNQLDYTTRMQQFFDYYLKGSPPPVWMTRGISAKDKGTLSGLELDTTNIQP